MASSLLRFSVLTALLLLTAAVLNRPAFATEPLTLGDVRLVPPPGFEVAPDFAGLRNVKKFSTLEIKEFDLPMAAVQAALTEAGFAEKGLRLIAEESIRSGTRDAVLYKLEATEGDMAFNEQRLLIGDSMRSLVITASYPGFADAELGYQLTASLKSIEWIRTAREQLFHDLPFTLEATVDLQITRRTGAMVILSDRSEAVVPVIGVTPSIVVGHLASVAALPPVKDLSHAHLEALQSFDMVELLSEGPRKIDGIPAYEIRAIAAAAIDGAEVAFTQVIAVQEKKYLLIQAAAPVDESDRYADQFTRIIDSVRFKPRFASP